MERPAHAAAELRRIVKPGGMCGVSLHGDARSARHRVLNTRHNHPHHHGAPRPRALLAEQFDDVELTYVASMLEDQPEFALSSALRSTNRPMARCAG
jgi:hypothetical protein